MQSPLTHGGPQVTTSSSCGHGLELLICGLDLLAELSLADQLGGLLGRRGCGTRAYRPPAADVPKPPRRPLEALGLAPSSAYGEFAFPEAGSAGAAGLRAGAGALVRKPSDAHRLARVVRTS